MSNRCIIIAEVGVNHNGSPDMALEMIDVAAKAGADIVKFQTAIPEEVVSHHASKATYQAERTGSDGTQLDMVRALHFNKNRKQIYEQLVDRASAQGIEFLSTPFDLESLNFLVHDLGLKRLKLASGEITNAPLLFAAAQTGCDVLLSTGMATEDEIEAALGVLALGYLDPTASPSRQAFIDAYSSEVGRSALLEKVTLLHCVTSYPTPLSAANLRAIQAIQQKFFLRTGYSDHTPGIIAALAAVALGAVVVEKHFTLDRTLPGPDHSASLEPNELEDLIRQIRLVETALGDGIKKPQPCEMGNIEVARRSLCARADIKSGDIFNPLNLTSKRPATGLSPFLYWDLLGRAAKLAYSMDAPISSDELLSD